MRVCRVRTRKRGQDDVDDDEVLEEGNPRLRAVPHPEG